MAEATGIPQQRGPRIERFALRRRIEDTVEPLLFVVAPAGFGKTSVLADWARTTSHDVLWFTCLPSDNDPGSFWRRLLAALAERWPATGQDAALLLARASWQEPDLLEALANDLDDAALAGVVLVVDDCHLATSSQGALVGLAQILPRGVRLILASQHNLSVSSSKLHVSGVYGELRSTDLAFGQSETDELLGLAGLELVEAERRQLQELTQGWPTGLQLASLAMRSARDPADVLAAFAASPHEVSDYLVNEVLDRMAPELADFMTRISVLGEFDRDLCQAVTGRDDVERLLGEVIEHDAFIQESTRGRGWYQFHPMFNAFLQARLKGTDPESYEQLHRRSLAARREDGDLAGALGHATAVNDLEVAAALVTESLARGLEVGNVRTGQSVARAWLDRFGTDAAAADPQRLLEVLLVLTSAGTREPERWLTMIGRRLQRGELAPAVAALYHGAVADHRLSRGEVERCLVHNRRAQQLLGELDDPQSAFARFAELPIQQLGAHLLVGDLGAAVDSLRENGPVPHTLIDDHRVPVLRSWVAFLEGDLATARQGLRLVERAEAGHEGVVHGLERIFTDLLRGGLAIEDGCLDDAARAFGRTASASDLNGRPVIQSLVDVWLARLATAQHKHEAAVGALAQARLVLDQPDLAVQQHLGLEMLRVSFAFNTHQTTYTDVPTTEGRLLRARWLLDQRSYRQAAALLDSLEPLTTRERVDWHLLNALTWRQRDPACALRHTGLALELAEPHGYLSTIVGAGPGLEDLLRSMPLDGLLTPYVDRLLRAMERAGGPAGPNGAGPTAETLSSRELTVLGLLSSRLTSREIADTLFISPNTLKTHTKSIYRKLGVSSRTQAARQAGSLDLSSPRTG